MKSEMKIGF